MKVTEKDLIGDIKGFPIEVVQRMVDCQVEQGNDADVRVFQNKKDSDLEENGFKFCRTKENLSFWVDVIDGENFGLFFQRYPKQEPKIVKH